LQILLRPTRLPEDTRVDGVQAMGCMGPRALIAPTAMATHHIMAPIQDMEVCTMVMVLMLVVMASRPQADTDRRSGAVMDSHQEAVTDSQLRTPTSVRDLNPRRRRHDTLAGLAHLHLQPSMQYDRTNRESCCTIV